MAVVRWSAEATHHLASISDFLRTVEPRAVEVLARRLRQAEQQIEMFPYSGEALKDFGLSSARELVIGNIRLTYLVVSEEEIIVIALRSGPRRYG